MTNSRKSFSATPLPFLVGTEFLLWDFISATFDSLSKASCTFIVPRCLSLWPDIQDVVYKYWDICLIPNIFVKYVWFNASAKKTYLVKRFNVSNFYWFKKVIMSCNFFSKFSAILLVSVDSYFSNTRMVEMVGWISSKWLIKTQMAFLEKFPASTINHVAQKYSRLLYFWCSLLN